MYNPLLYQRPGTIGGFEIVEHSPMVTRLLRRSWRERLFTLPWRPFVKTKTVQVPNPLFPLGSEIFRVGYQLHALPDTIRHMRNMLRVSP